MAGTAPRLPELLSSVTDPIDFTVSELVSDAAGAHSPFGDIDIPMPVDKLFYKHPSPVNRPNLAEGR
jgi:hypothetical protein